MHFLVTQDCINCRDLLKVMCVRMEYILKEIYFMMSAEANSVVILRIRVASSGLAVPTLRCPSNVFGNHWTLSG
jgi:hypothetical protein